jgi:hypothetical protein
LKERKKKKQRYLIFNEMNTKRHLEGEEEESMILNENIKSFVSKKSAGTKNKGLI